MSDDTITELTDPSGFSSDPFIDVLRDGARKLIEQVIHAELAALMAAFSKDTLEHGRARLVRHNRLPEREVTTGIGPVHVRVPPVRDRGTGEDRITFTPSILPRYLRKARSVEEVLPWLYLNRSLKKDFLSTSSMPDPNNFPQLDESARKTCPSWHKRSDGGLFQRPVKGLSAGDFTEALEALLGPNGRGPSAKTLTKLEADWWTDYEAWQKRDLGARRFLCIWADGVYFKPRMSK